MRPLTPLVLLIACGDGPTLTKINTAPSVVITSHVDGDVISEPGDVTFVVDATDPESGPDDLTLEWRIDGAAACADSIIDEEDQSSCTVELLRGTHVVSVTVADPDREQATAQISVDVLQPNRAPECGISVPTDGAELRLGEPVAVVGVATDPDTDPTTLIASLFSDVDGALDTVTPSSNGEVLFNVPELSGATHLLTMRIEDPDGAQCSDTTTVIVGQPPSIVLTAPAADAVVDVGVPTRLEATTTDPDNSPPDLQVSWESDRDGVLGLSTPDADGLASLTTQALTRGTHIWSATVADPDELTASASRTLLVNGPPDAPGVDVRPAAPAPGDALTASIASASTDLEGDPVTYTWSWTRDGAPAGAGPTVPAGVVRRGEIWEASAIPNDGRIDGEAGTAAVSVGNARPVVTQVTLSPTDAITGDRMFAQATGEDADGDPLTWSYTWAIDGAVVATGASARFDGVVRGETVTVTATASDALVASLPLQSAGVLIGNAPPSLTGARIEPSQPTWADVVTCLAEGYADPEGDAAANEVQWSIDGVVEPTLTGNELPAQTYTRGTQVQCTLTPSDGADAGQPVSSQVITYGNSPPVVVHASLSPDPASILDTLSVTGLNTTDPDGDPVSTSISWRALGSSVGNGPTLVLSQLRRGDRVFADLVPTDGIDDGPVETLQLDIGNAAPFDVAVSLSPDAPSTSSDITASATATDVDGDTITAIAHEWRVNNLVAASTSAVLPASAFGSGDEIRVLVTVSDGNGGTATGTSVPLVIGNTGPSAPGLRVQPPVSDGSIGLQCTVSEPSIDSDGDALTYTMAWELEGTPYSGPTTTTTWPGDTIAASDLVPGRWTCTATATDGVVPSPAGEDDARVIPPAADVMLASGANHHCAVLSGEAVCWGGFGPQLGQGHNDSIGDDPGELGSTPTLPLGAHVRQLAAGGDNTCALLDNNTVKCWGFGGFGLPGQGNDDDVGDAPGELAALAEVPLGNVPIAQLVAHSHACIRTTDGRVACWGNNTQGQLGLGDTRHRGDDPGELSSALPWVDLGEDRGAIDIAVGNGVTCALLDNNTVKCWGSSSFGALGLGAGSGDRGDESDEMGDDLPAVDVGPGEIASIHLASSSPCVQFDDGRVRCWGANARGELGLGDTESRGDDANEMGGQLPDLDVGTGRTVDVLALGSQTHCALLDDGSLKCWGRGSQGALGSGATEDLADDAQEIGDNLPELPWRGPRPVALSSTGRSTCALLPCGDLRCWGLNQQGQLGLGDQRNRGDDPRELGDALPRVDLGGRRSVQSASPSSCTRWSHTITVDGNDGDWLAEEVFATSSSPSIPGTGSRLMVSWDEDWVYLGTRHPDALSGGDEHWFVAYLGNGTDRAAVVSQPGFRFGVPHANQEPELAVEAQTLLRTKATGSFDQLAIANYPAGVPTWESLGSLSGGAQGTQIARSGDVIEMRVSRETLGLHQILYLQTQWLFEGAGFESSYAACPITMFPDASFDPDYTDYFRFDLDHPAGPGAGGIEPALP